MDKKPRMLTWADFTPDFPVWKLHPAGCTLATKELAPGVYALISSIPGVDNAGFVVGEKGVLVIDAHILSRNAYPLHPDDRSRDPDPGPLRTPGTVGPVAVYALLQPAHQRHKTGPERRMDVGGDP